jgi:hypothetical protein
MLTQDELIELFEYRDGNLYWRKQPRPNYPIDITEFAGCFHNGYLQVGVKGKRYKAHRLIFLIHHGFLPEHIDHIDRNSLNNKIENLRIATKAENGWNRGKNKNNSSGYKGVHWNKFAGKWQAQIMINNKKKHLGYFVCLEEAYKTYCTIANKYHGEFYNE